MAHSYFRSMLVRLLLLAGIPSLVFPTIFILDEYRAGERHLAEMCRQIQANVSQASKEGFLTEQVDHYLVPLADSALLNPEIQAVAFRRADGSLLLWRSKGEGNEDQILKAFDPGGGDAQQGKTVLGKKPFLFASGPVRTWRMTGAEQLFGLEKGRAETTLGTVTVLASPESLLRRLRTRLLQSLAAICLLLLLASMAAFSIARRVTRPVEELIAGFRAIEGGNYEPAMTRPKQHELVLLVDQFRETARRLRELIKEKDSYSEQLLETAKELEDLNESLEQKIAERTHSLTNANEMLELSNRKIQEADRLKSEFLANMSHELRTPLNAVIGFSELLLEKIPGPVTPQQEQCLMDILNAGQHLLQLINEILDLSKVEAGKTPLNFTTLRVEALISEVQTLFKPILDKKRQALIVSCEDPQKTLYTDQHKLKQVLINLLSNAHKFSPEESRIWLSVSHGPGWHSISVRDEGIGIPENQHELVFEAFRQLDGSMSRSQEGTGLGLTLCKRFTELLGGIIALKSAPGEGATFTLFLPVEPSKALDTDQISAVQNGQGACG
jgi:signal transduction histidine kinase